MAKQNWDLTYFFKRQEEFDTALENNHFDGFIPSMVFLPAALSKKPINSVLVIIDVLFCQ